MAASNIVDAAGADPERSSLLTQAEAALYSSMSRPQDVKTAELGKDSNTSSQTDTCVRHVLVPHYLCTCLH